MAPQSEAEQALQKAYAERLAAIKADTSLTILEQSNEQTTAKIKPYVVYTNFNRDRIEQKSCSVFVYTPYANVDKYGHSKTDYQCELLFEYNAWERNIHMTVLETLGSESQLAFYDFQNHGLAQLALKNLLAQAQANQVQSIDGNISSFDGTNLAKVKHLFQKFGFTVKIQDEARGLASVKLILAEK